MRTCKEILLSAAICVGTLNGHLVKGHMPKAEQHTATHYNTLQHTAINCNKLQHTATHCNTLQHTTTPDEGAYAEDRAAAMQSHRPLPILALPLSHLHSRERVLHVLPLLSRTPVREPFHDSVLDVSPVHSRESVLSVFPLPATRQALGARLMCSRISPK